MDDIKQNIDDESETMKAIMEMAEERYICTVEEHNKDTDEFFVVWKDYADTEWGCWFSRRLLNEIFAAVTLN
jgi:hypothetical protein